MIELAGRRVWGWRVGNHLNMIWFTIERAVLELSRGAKACNAGGTHLGSWRGGLGLGLAGREVLQGHRVSGGTHIR
jgi:hypothetical protein